MSITGTKQVEMLPGATFLHCVQRSVRVNRAIPPLTVGMPVYDGEQYVAEALDSILAQTYADFKLIISDNASRDRTEAICRSYAARDNRIVYTRIEENIGAAGNFNRVFQLSRSPLFKFAAHDDLCAPRFLEICMNAFKEAPADVVLCFPSTTKIDSHGIQSGLIEENLDLRQDKPHKRFGAFLSAYQLSNCFYGIVRAAAYASTKMHQAFVAADVILLAELALRGQFWQLPEPFFMRRVHSGMSGQANPTLSSLALHYDTRYHGRAVYYRSKMLRELMRAIDTAPLTAYERIQCRTKLMTVWLPKYGTTIARELLDGLTTSLTRR